MSCNRSCNPKTARYRIASVTLFFDVFFFNDTATTEIYTLSLHDALPISLASSSASVSPTPRWAAQGTRRRSEEHTSELQSREKLVCRLLLEKQKQMRRVQALQYRLPVPNEHLIPRKHE